MYSAKERTVMRIKLTTLLALALFAVTSLSGCYVYEHDDDYHRGHGYYRDGYYRDGYYRDGWHHDRD
jgi:hypothetical protein